jgi:phosphatidylinositol glycan class Z
LNNLFYNTQSSNLAQHGLHPHFTHSLLNIPLLFTPILYLALPHQFSHCKLSNLPLLTLLSSTIILSVFPHQEPRFLLPISPIVALIAGRFVHSVSSKNGRSVLISCWIIFHLLMATFFGFLHQSSVVRLLTSARFYQNLAMDRNISNIDFVFIETYMTPESLVLTKSRTPTVTLRTGCRHSSRWSLN